jgi:glycosyltransferase involved in cell wall biosynthesis/SAM-dependent methyltransferase
MTHTELSIGTTDSNYPVISCLCVTENRLAFMPWLLWNFAKQTWSQRELIIVDSSAEPFEWDGDDIVHVIPVSPGTNVPAKRNIALQNARGSVITWFDDDDWQHPDKCRWLAEALQGGAPYAGTCSGWFVNLETLRCAPHISRSRQIVFNSAGFLRDVAVTGKFPEERRRASDSLWLQAIKRRYPRGVELHDKIPFFWLCHRQNISNPANKRRFATGIEHVKTLVESAAWGDTDDALAELRARLAQAHVPASNVARTGKAQHPAARAPHPRARQDRGSATTQPLPSKGNNQHVTGRRIGILAVNDPRRGLWRDAECLLWALTDERIRPLHLPGQVTLFPIDSVRSAERNLAGCRAGRAQVRCAGAVAPGMLLSDWLTRIDTLIVCEDLLPDLFRRAHDRGIHVVYIPNLDWALVDGTVEKWLKEVKAGYCRVWAKTQQIHRTLAAHGVDSDLVPWSIPDPVRRDRPARDKPVVRFVINAGMGGWRSRRGVDIALAAYAKVRSQRTDVACTVKSIRPLRSYVPEHLLRTEGLEIVENMVSRDEIAHLYARADVILYPSRWEGFGLSLLEALHAGVPVIATDGWPMNELVQDGHNGLLAAAQSKGSLRLAAHWECDADHLAKQMLRLVEDRSLLQRLTCPEPSELCCRQYHFVLRVRELALGEMTPRIVLFRPRGEPAWRRSEEYWADALRRHGYRVDVGFFETSAAAVREMLAAPHELVLVSKAPIAFLRRLKAATNRPVVLWHHDLCSTRHRWVETVAAMVDLLLVPESGLEKRAQLRGTPAVMLMPGAKVDGDRGPGRRPRLLPETDTRAEVAFVGNRGTGTRRVHLLQKIAQHTNLYVYGEGWRTRGLRVQPPVWSHQALELHRRAAIVLSISHDASTPHYTSNRLFNSCGAGACVVAEAYPGIADHYPDTAVATFRTPQQCVAIIEYLHRNRDLRIRMRQAAEEHTWRHHTWADRIACLLVEVQKLQQGKPHHAVATASAESHRQAGDGAGPSDPILLASAEFWNQRCRQMGRRAPGYYRLSDDAYSRTTDAWWQRLSPLFLAEQLPAQSRVLDFGCGEGRFARRLAALGFNVIGADISREMLRIAAQSPHPNLMLRQLPMHGAWEFADGHFDGLWVSTVLQHIPDAIFGAVVQELRRVASPGSWVLLCENIHDYGRRTSSSGHVVFRRSEEYLRAFPGLRVVDSFEANGERHAVFAGRLHIQRDVRPTAATELEVFDP